MAELLSRARIVAGPGFNRWLVPPAALAIHLCIGQAYAFSVFKLPLTKVLGITESGAGRLEAVRARLDLHHRHRVSRAVRRGVRPVARARRPPQERRRGGLLLGARLLHLGASASKLHNIWLLYLGYGVLGGCGLGLGYITPVSTLIKWFPDRRGMATGMAIMGFGGGAMIASPLSQLLLDHFKSPTSVGVAETFVVLGAHLLRRDDVRRVPVPRAGARDGSRAGWEPPAATSHELHHPAARARGRGDQDRAVLSALGACCSST